MASAPVLTLGSGPAHAVLRGHPWVYRQAIARAPTGLHTGDAVELHDPSGRFLARGLWDASSPIAVRVYGREAARELDARALGRLVEQAITRRSALHGSAETSAYRLCNGEGDRVPGLVIDRYASTAVVRLDGDAVVPWLPRLQAHLWPRLQELGVRAVGLRTLARGSGTQLEPLWGEAPPASVTVRENGMAMVVDLARGQKTGAFLDQRDNRARVRTLAHGKSVLNLFSYAGGFSIAAGLGGATQVTSVDLAQAAHATAQLSVKANALAASTHSWVTADAFTYLESAAKKGLRWDLIVSDPPSFAPNEKALIRALAAYRKLHAACAAVLAPGGVLCASSCSSHVNAEDFVATLDDVALARSDLALVGLYGSPWDHPTLPSWPEGRYLKFAILT
jgi:23S rRNA (cytosine1962-C5)-methyltransferase